MSLLCLDGCEVVAVLERAAVKGDVLGCVGAVVNAATLGAGSDVAEASVEGRVLLSGGGLKAIELATGVGALSFDSLGVVKESFDPDEGEGE